MPLTSSCRVGQGCRRHRAGKFRYPTRRPRTIGATGVPRSVAQRDVDRCWSAACAEYASPVVCIGLYASRPHQGSARACRGCWTSRAGPVAVDLLDQVDGFMITTLDRPPERHPLVPHAGAGSAPTSGDAPVRGRSVPRDPAAGRTRLRRLPSRRNLAKITGRLRPPRRSSTGPKALPRIVRPRRFPCEVPCRVRLIAGQEPGRSREITAAKC